jgi:alcohol dehydrogenase class IV
MSATSLPLPDGLAADLQRSGVFGSGSLTGLPEVLKGMSARRVLLLTGRSSFQMSGAAEVLPELEAFADVYVWNDFRTNTDSRDVIVGTEIVRNFDPDVIVAIGGGSTMDLAKILSVFGDFIDATAVEEAIRAVEVRGRDRHLVLVPTTSGSGSEATHFAVVYIGEDKYSVADRSLLADFVVLDPSLTLSGSAYQKATSGIDAVMQASESMWANAADETSLAFASRALSLLVDALPGFVAGNSATATAMAEGSYLAGRAIDITNTTGPHAMAYGLTKQFGISHGHAVVATFSAFANKHALAARTSAADTARLSRLALVLGASGPDDIGSRLCRLATDVGLPVRLRDLGVPYEALPRLAAAVNVERLSNNPVDLTSSDLRDILDASW